MNYAMFADNLKRFVSKMWPGFPGYPLAKFDSVETRINARGSTLFETHADYPA